MNKKLLLLTLALIPQALFSAAAGSEGEEKRDPVSRTATATPGIELAQANSTSALAIVPAYNKEIARLLCSAKPELQAQAEEVRTFFLDLAAQTPGQNESQDQLLARMTNTFVDQLSRKSTPDVINLAKALSAKGVDAPVFAIGEYLAQQFIKNKGDEYLVDEFNQISTVGNIAFTQTVLERSGAKRFFTDTELGKNKKIPCPIPGHLSMPALAALVQLHEDIENNTFKDKKIPKNYQPLKTIGMSAAKTAGPAVLGFLAQQGFQHAGITAATVGCGACVIN